MKYHIHQQSNEHTRSVSTNDLYVEHRKYLIAWKWKLGCYTSFFLARMKIKALHSSPMYFACINKIWWSSYQLRDSHYEAEAIS